MAGYSGTPLAKKLGIKEGARLWIENAPSDYLALLAPLPAGVTFAAKLSKQIDLIHLFTSAARQLESRLGLYRRTMDPAAVIWVSWPKQASRVATDVTEDVIRDHALPLGLVDIKVCAVDQVWSGLKLVLRRELRER